MKKAVILHAWYSNPATNWYPWLKAELEKRDYLVWVPELPTMGTKNPQMEEMLKLIIDNGFVDEETIVIGHSLGAVLAMRLAERLSYAKGILLAAWDYNDLTPEHQSFWQTMIDHNKAKKNVCDWVFLISENDPYVTKAIAHEMAGRFGGVAVDVGARGHFGKKDGIIKVREILDYV